MGQKSRAKAERRALADAVLAPPKWTPFQQCDTIAGPNGMPMAIPPGYVIFRNSRYQVWLRRIPAARGFPEMAWLSIKRNDRRPIHDWRDLHRIKNELIGPEHEAVELYPAESRLVDSSNQYHLWAAMDPAFRFPFGYTERDVTEDPGGDAAQRPFEPPA